MVTIEGERHPVGRWKDEPLGELELSAGQWDLVAETDDFDLAIRAFEKLKAKLQC